MYGNFDCVVTCCDLDVTAEVVSALDGDDEDSVLAQLRALFANLRTADGMVSPAPFTGAFRPERFCDEPPAWDCCASRPSTFADA